MLRSGVILLAAAASSDAFTLRPTGAMLHRGAHQLSSTSILRAQPPARLNVRAQPLGLRMQKKLGKKDSDVAVPLQATAVAPAESSPDEAAIFKTRAILLLVAALYGTNFGSIKIMQEALLPSEAALLRFTLALAALSPFLLSTPKALVKPGLEIGIWVALGYVVQGIGLETADASTAAFLCSLAVVVCPLLDLFAGERVKGKSWVAAALAVMGVGVLELSSGSAPTSGDLWALLQPIGFGMGFWKIERVMKDFPGYGPQLTALQLVVVFFTGLVWSVADAGGLPDFGHIAEACSTLPVVSSVVWTGLVTTALTVLLQTTSLGVLSSTETTVLYSTEPIWGAAFASVVMRCPYSEVNLLDYCCCSEVLMIFGLQALGEQIGMNTVFGGSLILAACLASSVDTDALLHKENGEPNGVLAALQAGLVAVPGGAAVLQMLESVSEDGSKYL